MTATAQELTSRGVALARQQQLAEAIALFEEAIRLDPGFALAHRNLGYARELRGDLAGAIACYRQAVEIKPTSIDTLSRLGETLFKMGALEEAVNTFQVACEMAPEKSSTQNNLAVALAKLHRYPEAVAAFRRAIELDPNCVTAYSGLGAALSTQREYEAAEEILLRAIELAPDDASAHSNLGIVYKQLGRLDAALRYYDRALELKPDYPEAEKARALCRLLRGDYLAGWPGYELRERLDDLRVVHNAPRWKGESLAGRTLLIESEQGLGDTVQFVRYAAEVKRCHDARIIFAGEPKLLALLRSAPGIDVLISQDQRRPAFDIWTSLLSLPGIFGHTAETFPAPIPYLYAEPARVEHWKSCLSSLAGKTIGVCWQGNTDNQQNLNRSFPLSSFAPIAAVGGVRLISLQKGAGTEEIDGCGFEVHSLADDFDSGASAFLDTAAVMMNLDLVISADTSIAHLAGALGVPVWVPLPRVPDWRWGMQGECTPWYPTMRLFRQTMRGQWHDVFERITVALSSLSSPQSA